MTDNNPDSELFSRGKSAGRACRIIRTMIRNDNHPKPQFKQIERNAPSAGGEKSVNLQGEVGKYDFRVAVLSDVTKTEIKLLE